MIPKMYAPCLLQDVIKLEVLQAITIPKNKRKYQQIYVEPLKRIRKENVTVSAE